MRYDYMLFSWSLLYVTTKVWLYNPLSGRPSYTCSGQRVASPRNVGKMVILIWCLVFEAPRGVRYFSTHEVEV